MPDDSTSSSAPESNLVPRTFYFLITGKTPPPCPCDEFEWEDWVNEVPGETCGDAFGWVRKYRLKDYSDYDLTPCGLPDCADSDLEPWNGEFWASIYGKCIWGSGDQGSGHSISGKQLEFGTVVGARVWLDEMSDRWYLDIVCSNGPPGSQFGDIWVGFKYYGQTPAGIYTRDHGCDTTSTLEIEEVP